MDMLKKRSCKKGKGRLRQQPVNLQRGTKKNTKRNMKNQAEDPRIRGQRGKKIKGNLLAKRNQKKEQRMSWGRYERNCDKKGDSIPTQQGRIPKVRAQTKFCKKKRRGTSDMVIKRTRERGGGGSIGKMQGRGTSSASTQAS